MTVLQIDQDAERDPVWGPLSHPNRLDPPPGGLPWRDHIYMAYWDPAACVYGVLHWNTSPNSTSGKTQVTAFVDGSFFELIEGIQAEKAEYSSETTWFDMRGRVEINAGRFTGSLNLSPRYRPCESTGRGVVPSLDPAEPFKHFQQGFDVTGHLALDGRRTDIDGRGYRTRSWGFRDESRQFVEYFSVQACLDDFDVALLKFKWPDGSIKADGFIVLEDRTEPVRGVHIVRNPSSLLSRVNVELENGSEMEIVALKRVADTWAPMGPRESFGPTFGEFDEFVEVDVAGVRGHAMVTHGCLRTLF